MQRKFQDILHKYKLDLFHAQHDKKTAEEISSEVLFWTDDVLKQKLSYHFHSLPDASRVEIINMINNYVRDSWLTDLLDTVRIGGSFNTIIGLVFLVIVIVSPDGLMGVWDRLWELGRRGGGSGGSAVTAIPAGEKV